MEWIDNTQLWTGLVHWMEVEGGSECDGSFTLRSKLRSTPRWMVCCWPMRGTRRFLLASRCPDRWGWTPRALPPAHPLQGNSRGRAPACRSDMICVAWPPGLQCIHCRRGGRMGHMDGRLWGSYPPPDRHHIRCPSYTRHRRRRQRQSWKSLLVYQSIWCNGRSRW